MCNQFSPGLPNKIESARVNSGFPVVRTDDRPGGRVDVRPRDHGKKRSSPPVFLNNWPHFRVRGQFEIKILIVLGHSDIFHINLKKTNLSLRSFEN